MATSQFGPVVRVLYSEIPEYLQDSIFYAALYGDEEDSFVEIFERDWKKDDSISNMEDLNRILHVIRFWGVNTIPDNVLRFCESSGRDWVRHCTIASDSEICAALVNYFRSETYLHRLLTTREELLNHWMSVNSPDSVWGLKAVTFVAKHGKLKVLKLLHENGYPWNYTTNIEAAKYGHFSCLRYVHENGCPWSEEVCSVAAQNGCIKCLEYAYENGCPWNRDVSLTTKYKCLEYALRHNCLVHRDCLVQLVSADKTSCVLLLHDYGLPVDDSVLTETAAKLGRLAMLKLLVRLGCTCDTRAVVAAASAASEHRNEALKCLQFLVSDHLIAMNDAAFSSALLRGSLSIVKYLVDTGCTCEFVMPHDKDSLRLILPRIDGDVKQCFQYTVEHGFCSEVFDSFIATVFENVMPICQEYMLSIDLGSGFVIGENESVDARELENETSFYVVGSSSVPSASLGMDNDESSILVSSVLDLARHESSVSDLLRLVSELLDLRTDIT